LAIASHCQAVLAASLLLLASRSQRSSSTQVTKKVFNITHHGDLGSFAPNLNHVRLYLSPGVSKFSLVRQPCLASRKACETSPPVRQPLHVAPWPVEATELVDAVEQGIKEIWQTRYKLCPSVIKHP
jgi:hypothetical protein